ncbi:MAG: polysaccharide deacetylase family protein [Candidatus Hydrogenedentes bacterium]|nr:polysaccharide deacetylase family protein [Candidatus Hydrogenedentota bacterium]
MSLASNRGTIEALEFGLVTSTSMMMPTPWVAGFARYLKDHPDTDVGLHLTMTSEWDDYRWAPVAGKPTVPTLADKQGCLWDGNELVYQHASADDVEEEIRAQVDRALAMDIKVSHLDSHMGTLFYNPALFERFKKVAIEKQIPLLMMAEHPAAEEVWKAGLPVIDHLHTDSYDWKTTDKKQQYIAAVRNLKPGITEMIVHSTKPDDVIGVITGGRDHLYADYSALTDPEVKKVAEEEKIILTTWRELKDRRDKAGQN